ncbi:hypothetical protein N0V88_006275 [Collariella sp. IMI 366227]|nr:hypothetical protein N0V88_006275 [Collariella sp. IMI 366227]
MTDPGTANVLTSWWITLLCGVIIVLRLVGRFVRVEKLFKEDWVAAAALIPLLWLLKVVTLEFFDRLVGFSGRNRYTALLRFMRISLGATFLAIIIADLAECRPFPHYFQVSPDSGGQCRQGYAHLLTVTTGNAFTDLLLVVFPVPIVLKSRLSKSRKFMLVLLFCLHLFTVVVAVYKVPAILKEDGYQGTRTMWASAEILMATFAANALTIGTFVRDTGVKKKKFKVVGKKGSWDDEVESDGEGRRVEDGD